jgi:hypothetical protein
MASANLCPQCHKERQKEADAERQWTGLREGQRIGRKEYEP